MSVEETESLQELDAFPLVGENSETGTGGIFRDMLACHGAEALYRYGDAFYGEYAAVTRNRYGSGAVYYFGCGLDAQTTETLLRRILAEASIAAIPSDSGVEVVGRGGEEQRIRMFINHNAWEASACGVTLPPFGCRIETL